MKRSPPPRARSPKNKGLQLFVAGLSFITNEKDLEEKFGKYGRVKECRVVRNPHTGESRGFAFVVMEKEDEVDRAIRHMDGREWSGRRLLVEVAKHPR